MRGLAILLVMWNHFTPPVLVGATSFFGRLGHRLLNGGWAGVDLFFVLSGFLITGILLDAKRAGATPRRYFTSFYARRTLRIFPLYYAVLVGVSLFAIFFADASFRAAWIDHCGWLWFYASNILTAQQGWSFRFGDLLLNHFWSLAVEEQFYLVWPLLIFLCGRGSLRVACAAAIALAPVLRYHFAGIENNGYAAFVLMPCRIDAFAAGAIAAMISREARSPGRTGVAIAAIGAMLLVPTFSNDIALATAGRSVLAIGSAGFILLAVHTRLSRPLSLLPLRFFGKYSYGLYVWHFLFFHAMDRMFPFEQFGMIGRFIGCVAVSCAIAWCSWHLLEKHFLKLKRRFPMNDGARKVPGSERPPVAPVALAA